MKALGVFKALHEIRCDDIACGLAGIGGPLRLGAVLRCGQADFHVFGNEKIGLSQAQRDVGFRCGVRNSQPALKMALGASIREAFLSLTGGGVMTCPRRGVLGYAHDQAGCRSETQTGWEASDRMQYAMMLRLSS